MTVDRGSFPFLFAAIAACVTASVVEGVHRTHVPGPRWGFLTSGAVLAAAGFFLRALSYRALPENRHRAVFVESGQSLVTGGIYGRVRHPNYAALVLLCGAAVAAGGSVAGAVLLCAAVLPAIAYRIHVEERAMRERFGGDFEAYRRRVPAFLPRSVRTRQDG